jgi:hypothetical protein
MATHNDITGDALVSRKLSSEGESNWDNIFTKRKTNGGWKPPLSPLTPKSEPVQLELDFGDEEAERRMDIIGSNGNIGYEESK